MFPRILLIACFLLTANYSLAQKPDSRLTLAEELEVSAAELDVAELNVAKADSITAVESADITTQEVDAEAAELASRPALAASLNLDEQLNDFAQQELTEDGKLMDTLDNLRIGMIDEQPILRVEIFNKSKKAKLADREAAINSPDSILHEQRTFDYISK